MMFDKKVAPVGSVSRSLGLYLLAGLVFAGSVSAQSVLGSGKGVTASESYRMTQSGFLSDYGRLQPSTIDEGVECWHVSDLDMKAYDKVMISRILVSLKSGQLHAADPTDLKTLTDYFHHSQVKALEPQMQVVDQPGAGVIGLRIALTDLMPTEVSRSVIGSLIPYGFVAEVGSGAATGRPAGSTPYLGKNRRYLLYDRSEDKEKGSG